MIFAKMQHKAEWMGHPMRLELTLADLLDKLANHYTTRDAQLNVYYISVNTRVSQMFITM